jgi:hypothetical protein
VDVRRNTHSDRSTLGFVGDVVAPKARTESGVQFFFPLFQQAVFIVGDGGRSRSMNE